MAEEENEGVYRQKKKKKLFSGDSQVSSVLHQAETQKYSVCLQLATGKRQHHSSCLKVIHHTHNRSVLSNNTVFYLYILLVPVTLGWLGSAQLESLVQRPGQMQELERRLVPS